MKKRVPAPAVWAERHIVTPFESRMSEEFERLRRDRTASVLYAESGAGKSSAKRQAVLAAGGSKGEGETVQPVLTARIPHSGPQTADKLVIELLADTGLLRIVKPAERRRALVDFIGDAGVELIIIDDFHEVSMPQCDVVREISDQLDRPVGWAFLAALATKDPTRCDPMHLLNTSPRRAEAFQFMRRLEDDPWVLVPGHDAAEVGDILATFDGIYGPQLPGLALERFTDQVFEGMTDPRVDWLGTGTARMNAIAGFVRRLLKRMAEEGAGELTERAVSEALEDYAQRDQTYVVAGQRRKPRRPRSPRKEA